MPHRQNTLSPFALLFGVIVTIALVYSAVNYSIDRDRDTNLTSSIYIKDLLERKINLLNEVIHSMRTLFDVSSYVNSDEFRLISTDLLARHPYVLSTNYLPLVTSERKNIFEEKMLDQGFITFAMTQLRGGKIVSAQERTRYFPVVYREPFTPLNARQLGLDYLSHPTLEKVINKAIDSSTAVTSTPIKFGSADRELIIFKAVYAGKDTPPTVEQRQKTVNGLIALHIDASALLTMGTDDPNKNLQLSLLPDSNSDVTIGVAAYGQAMQQNSYKVIKQFSHSFTIQSEEQTYVLSISEPLYWTNIKLTLPVTALLTGIILTTFLVMQMRTIIKREEDLEKRNEEIQAVVLLRTSELEFEKERAQTTLESISDAVITTDSSGNIQYMNPVAESMTGWEEKEAIERPIAEVFNITHQNKKIYIKNPVQECLKKGQVIQLKGSVNLLHKSGKSIAFESAASPLTDKKDEIIGAVLIAHDVSDARRIAKLMKHQAMHDSLTGLPNRALLFDRLKQTLLRAPWNKKCVALMFLDLDRFKVVNDTLGHNAGDQLLCQVAERLRNELRDGDTVCRLGGDEFVIILRDIAHQNHIEELAEKVVAILRVPFQLNGTEFHTSASVGISMYPQDGQDPDLLMKKADTAMYRAKAKGKSTYVLYKEEMGRCDANSLNRETELHHAVERD
ncbi:diguanylate cyclase/phosphodiesterase (GGDEF & EAL domains) with PAS/PAC sensor(s) [hydrothermal vent metagenome]|uniref:Diguanylate cyclase/phosphodiesterase (GGDEF & EAL domains) with PAS/PAC sensor(S) n=1 Tax=hydrothermal vent metagenome TaxID=652676 RepID=A0A3B0Z3M9_9ZZZZ